MVRYYFFYGDGRSLYQYICIQIRYSQNHHILSSVRCNFSPNQGETSSFVVQIDFVFVFVLYVYCIIVLLGNMLKQDTCTVHYFVSFYFILSYHFYHLPSVRMPPRLTPSFDHNMTAPNFKSSSVQSEIGENYRMFPSCLHAIFINKQLSW